MENRRRIEQDQKADHNKAESADRQKQKRPLLNASRQEISLWNGANF